MTRKSLDAERVALFAGSFRPFTLGHLDILERGLKLFDRVVVVCGVNISKPGGDTAAVGQDIAALLSPLKRVTVAAWDGLTVDAAAAYNAGFLLRSVRTVADYEYERSLAEVNHRISGLDTVIFMSRPEYSSVSSSVVRELASYGRDVGSFLPSESDIERLAAETNDC